MSCEFLDVGNVGAVLKQVRAIGMAQKVWRQSFGNPGFDSKGDEEFRDVATIQTTRNASSDENCGKNIRSVVEEFLDPGDRGSSEKDLPGLAAFAYDFQLSLPFLKRSAVQRQGLRDTQARGEQHLKQHPKPQTSEGRNRYDLPDLFNFLIGQVLNMGFGSLGQLDFTRVQAIEP